MPLENKRSIHFWDENSVLLFPQASIPIFCHFTISAMHLSRMGKSTFLWSSH